MLVKRAGRGVRGRALGPPGGGDRGEGLAAAAGFSGQAVGREVLVFSCLAFQAARMRWLRTISCVVASSMSGPGTSGGTSRG